MKEADSSRSLESPPNASQIREPRSWVWDHAPDVRRSQMKGTKSTYVRKPAARRGSIAGMVRISSIMP